MWCNCVLSAASLCRMYSELISQSIATGGPHASKKSEVKMMRTAKKVNVWYVLWGLATG